MTKMKKRTKLDGLFLNIVYWIIGICLEQLG